VPFFDALPLTIRVTRDSGPINKHVRFAEIDDLAAVAIEGGWTHDACAGDPSKSSVSPEASGPRREAGAHVAQNNLLPQPATL
jgi:hypothetical protein